MRTLGLLGGATWRATGRYFTGLNEGVEAQLGAGRSARLVLHHIDYGALRAARAPGRWRSFARDLGRDCRGLQRAGAEALLLCSNTFHALADPISARAGLPVLHVADAVGAAAVAAGHRRVGLLGTAFTMTEPFYVERLRAWGLEVAVPTPDAIADLDRLLLEELAFGRGFDAAGRQVVALARSMPVDAVILGCTELSLLDLTDAELPRLDALALHVAAGVDWLTADESTREAP